MLFEIERASNTYCADLNIKHSCPYPGAFKIKDDSRGNPVWGIRIDTLEEMMDLVDKAGVGFQRYDGIVLSKDGIVIYDDYIE